jgi:hypothetical protein
VTKDSPCSVPAVARVGAEHFFMTLPSAVEAYREWLAKQVQPTDDQPANSGDL